MSGPQILIVEDERIIALDLRGRLHRLGYRVLGIVTSGPEAVEKAHTLRPDLVLMDVRLEGKMDGIAAAGQIRAHLDIPVIFLTAYTDEEILARARATRPGGCVIKPFDEGQIHNVIQAALPKGAPAKKPTELA